MRQFVIRLHSLASGGQSDFDGMYVKAYDPSYVNPETGYDGGLLEVTNEKAEALRFNEPVAAIDKWRETAPPPYHVRADGKPNRPLSAWSVEILPV